ncbi:uncharacterized protein PRCAT00000863001 [Priceomyces carsonii]|uniref:uncharacterized protein n=1 Tax=Priceomyces carsonii TaxID=28549 RepID=UPI002EDA64CE|nr:unnamed protein product [Priceomyces carsonii]
MLKWVQSGLSAVAGTAEPEYGKEAIHTITDSIKNGAKTWRETNAKDFSWLTPGFTNVETQTFYFTCLKSGLCGFAQVIHSNVMGVHTTAQFTFRLFHAEEGREVDKIWTSTKLENFRTEGPNFYADNLSIVLNEDDNQYVIKSSVTKESIVELTIDRLTPGVIFGEDGTTYYGDDLKNPWGSMRHLFWPRCNVKGIIITPAKSFEIEGLTMFVMAMQGMKPHHAAKSWNFLNFQSENFSAVQMEFTTPRSYACTKVNIGILCEKDKILLASIDNEVIHEDSQVDEVGWPVPKAITFKYDSLNDDKQEIVATVKGKLNTLVERIDVMAEIPQFVKNIVSGVAGAKPYIYQFCNEFKIKVEGREEETGIAFNEATFISD